MGNIHRPRRGSLAFSPRKRAKSQVPSISTWPETTESRLLGFAGYKAGMTHVLMVDDRPKGLSEGMEIVVPVTVIETPPLRIIGVRVYSRDTYGLNPATEAWAGNIDDDVNRRTRTPKNEKGIEHLTQLAEDGEISDVRAIVATRPSLVSGVDSKKPEIMEIAIGGTDVAAKLEYITPLMGKEINVNEVYRTGQLIDVVAVTKGKGTQGAIKRWGIQLQKGKHSRTGKRRHIGNLGPWHPHRVRWSVPQTGQMGYFRRTEYNKRILKIGEDGREVTPAGGFLKYGVARNQYILIKGSVPGPSRRLIRMRDPIRPSNIPQTEPELVHVSVASKQGV